MSNRNFSAFCTIFILLLPLLSLGISGSTIDGSDDPKKDTMFQGDFPENPTATIPQPSIRFIENRGQLGDDRIILYSWEDECKVAFRMQGITILTYPYLPTSLDEGVVGIEEGMKPIHGYQESLTGHSIDLTFKDANPVRPYGEGLLPGYYNFIYGDARGTWVKVPAYENVVYPNVWDGIDVVYKAVGGSFKYDMILQPGADPSQIGIQIDGHRSMAGLGSDVVRITTNDGYIDDSALEVYYQDDQDELIHASFEIQDHSTYGISLGDYDETRTVIIDPLIYSTYLGSEAYDHVGALEIDSQGHAFIAGSVNSPNFPTTPGAYDVEHNPSGAEDIFLTKMAKDGSSLVYSTFIGGNGSEKIRDIHVDESSSVYMAGYAFSADFPMTSDALDNVRSGKRDGIILKLSADGSQLEFSTFFGGYMDDYITGIALDSLGNLFISGATWSSDLNVTPGAYQDKLKVSPEGFVAKINWTNKSLSYCTFITGKREEYAVDIQVDDGGYAYVIGLTYSDNFQTTSGAFDTTYNGWFDVFVLKLNKQGTDVLYSTYLGGSKNDYGQEVELTPEGRAIVAGTTGSRDFPTTNKAFRKTSNADTLQEDGYIFKLSPTGSALAFSTYVAGRDVSLTALCIDEFNNPYIAGWTHNKNYPITANAHATNYRGTYSIFVTIFNNKGSDLLYSTFFGGGRQNNGQCMDIDGAGNIYVSGWTGSLDFPTTPNAYDRTYNGGFDLFVFKLFLDFPPEFSNDSTPRSAGTGDRIFFRVNVTAEIGVGLVEAEFWFGDPNNSSKAPLSLASGTDIDGRWSGILYLPINTTTTMSYKIIAKNWVGGFNETQVRMVTITDDDNPSLIDNCPSTVTTGDQFNMSVDVWDNIGISEVSCLMWFPGGGQVEQNMSLEPATSYGLANGTYIINLTAPSDSIEPLDYQFKVIDLSGNQMTTDQKEILVSDNDRPDFIHFNMDQNGTTGEQVNITAKVSDNVGIGKVEIKYWFGEDISTNFLERLTRWDLNGSGDAHYSVEVPLPVDSMDPLGFVLKVFDTSANSKVTGTYQIDIIDNDRPSLVNDLSDIQASTNETFHFEVQATDNIGISTAWVVYWFGEDASDPSENVMELKFKGPTRDTYAYNIRIPFDTIEDLHYYFSIQDVNGVYNTRYTVNVTVVDKIPPSIVEDETDPFVVKGLPHDMVVEVIDNVGIGEVHLVYWYGSSIPVNISMGDSSNPVFSLDVPRHPDGSLSYYYDVRDTSWNWYRTRTYMLPVVNVPPELNEIEEWEVTEGITETLDMSKYIIDLNDPVESLTLTARPNVEVEGLVLTLIHNEAIEGYELMISVSDGEDTSEFILNVIVVNVNDMPIITLIEPIDGMVYKTKEPITFHVLAEDEDGDDLIYSWFDGDTPIASNSTFTVSDLSPGNHLITIIVDDGTDHDSRTFNILVKGKKDDESPGFGATVTIMVILFVLMLTIIDMGRKRT